jgi:hypothetical protein
MRGHVDAPLRDDPQAGLFNDGVYGTCQVTGGCIWLENRKSALKRHDENPCFVCGTGGL